MSENITEQLKDSMKAVLHYTDMIPMAIYRDRRDLLIKYRIELGETVDKFSDLCHNSLETRDIEALSIIKTCPKIVSDCGILKNHISTYLRGKMKVVTGKEIG